ncbi:MAG: hypothetical protein JSV85_03940 [Candidatus Bathyarchaeota archaeon]|nr:MAG: hypothetical protein JSV85_03940 [Candidatus Bathyarchaeota archaeon]
MILQKHQSQMASIRMFPDLLPFIPAKVYESFVNPLQAFLKPWKWAPDRPQLL